MVLAEIFSHNVIGLGSITVSNNGILKSTIILETVSRNACNCMAFFRYKKIIIRIIQRMIVIIKWKGECTKHAGISFNMHNPELWVF